MDDKVAFRAGVQTAMPWIVGVLTHAADQTRRRAQDTEEDGEWSLASLEYRVDEAEAHIPGDLREAFHEGVVSILDYVGLLVRERMGNVSAAGLTRLEILKTRLHVA